MSRTTLKMGINTAILLIPIRGYPITRASRTSVLTDSSTMADALATALYVLGPEKGIPITGKVPRTSFRWDFIASENSTVFHNPTEALRILGEAIEPGHQAEQKAV